LLLERLTSQSTATGITTLASQGDHSPDTLKFPDISLTMCGTHAHVKWYSQHACSTSFNV